MFKKSIKFLFFGLLSILLIACSNDNQGSNGDKKDKEDIVELEMYSWRTEDKSAYEEIIKEFQVEHPNIKINFKPFESTEYNTILTNALVSGKGPDIIQLRPYSGARTIADNDYLVPLDDVVGINDIDDDYLNAAKGTDGKIYGIPLTLNAGVIFYNKNIFEEYNISPPKTWDEFEQISETLLKNGITPIAQGGRDAYLLSMLHGVISPSSYGGNEFVSELVEGNTDLTDKRMLDTLERMNDLEKYLPKDFIALDDNDAQAMFYAEEAAMYINGDYRLETFSKNIPDIPLGVIPALTDNNGEMSVMTWVDSSYGVVKNSDHTEEAMKFMEFMTTKEFGQAFTDNLSRISAVDGVESDNEIVQQITEASENSSTPYLMLVHYGDGSPSTKTVFEDGIQGIYLGEIAMDDLLKQVQENAEKAAEEENEE